MGELFDALVATARKHAAGYNWRISMGEQAPESLTLNLSVHLVPVQRATLVVTLEAWQGLSPGQSWLDRHVQEAVRALRERVESRL